MSLRGIIIKNLLEKIIKRSDGKLLEILADSESLIAFAIDKSERVIFKNKGFVRHFISGRNNTEEVYLKELFNEDNYSSLKEKLNEDSGFSLDIFLKTPLLSNIRIKLDVFNDDKDTIFLGDYPILTDDEIFRKISSLNNELANLIRTLSRKNRELESAKKHINTLSELLPICTHCKKIRDDKGYWNQVENYISEHTGSVFSHSICPDCLEKYFPDIAEEISKEKG